MHTACSVEPIYNSEHLIQDLGVVGRHLESMRSYSLTTDIAKMVENFTYTFQSFSNDFAVIESEVNEMVNNKKDEEYNNMKSRIKK